MIQISSKGATGSEASPLVESPWDQKMCETLPISRNGTFKNLQQLRSHFFDVFCIFHPRLILEFQAVTRVPQYVTGRHQAWDLFCAPFRSGCEAPAKRRWPSGINAADAAVLCGNPGCYKQKKPAIWEWFIPPIDWVYSTTNLKWSANNSSSKLKVTNHFYPVNPVTASIYQNMMEVHDKFSLIPNEIYGDLNSANCLAAAASCDLTWENRSGRLYTTGWLLLGAYDSWDLHIKWLPLSHFDDLTIQSSTLFGDFPAIAMFDFQRVIPTMVMFWR